MAMEMFWIGDFYCRKHGIENGHFYGSEFKMHALLCSESECTFISSRTQRLLFIGTEEGWLSPYIII